MNKIHNALMINPLELRKRLSEIFTNVKFPEVVMNCDFLPDEFESGMSDCLWSDLDITYLPCIDKDGKRYIYIKETGELYKF